MSASVGQVRLKHALATLRQRLNATRDQWNDEAREAFESEYIVPLEATIRKAIDALARVGEVSSAARRECE